jgi:hypothetical protein
MTDTISKGKPWRYTNGYYKEDSLIGGLIKCYCYREKDGEFDNVAGPAFISYTSNPDEPTKFVYKQIINNCDVKHKINGPALLTYLHGRLESEIYFLNDEKLTQEEYFEDLKKINFDDEYLPKGVYQVRTYYFFDKITEIIFLNSAGEFHCEDGPAKIGDGYYVYYLNGVVHRLDGPALCYGNIKYYYIDNKLLTEQEYYNDPRVIEYIKNKTTISKAEVKMTSIVKEFTRSKEDEYKDGYHTQLSGVYGDWFSIGKSAHHYWLNGKGIECHNSMGPAEIISSEYDNKKYFGIKYCQRGIKFKINGPALTKFTIDENNHINRYSESYYLNSGEVEFAQYYERLENLDFNLEILPKGVHKVVVRHDTIDGYYTKNNVRFLNKDGQEHCEDGPAVIFNDGMNAYYQNGKLHRLDGPAKCRPTFPSGFDKYFIDDIEYNVNDYYNHPLVKEYIKTNYLDKTEKEINKMSNQVKQDKKSFMDTMKHDAIEAGYSTLADTTVKVTQKALCRGLEKVGNDNAMILSLMLQHPSVNPILKMALGIGLTVAPQAQNNPHAVKVAEKCRQNAMADGMGYVADEIIKMMDGLTNVVAGLPKEEAQAKKRVQALPDKPEVIQEEQTQVPRKAAL